MRAVVILPAYDEAENVLTLSADILSRDPRLEVLVVDDASPDGTGDLVEGAQQTQPRLHLLRRPGKLGLGSAYLDGFRFALERDADLVLTMDCDYSHHPRYLPAVLEAAERADVVIGSRYVPGGGVVNWPLRRRLLSRFANAYTSFMLGVPVGDGTAGFRCYRREVIERVNPFEVRSSGYSFLYEMAFRVHCAGFSIAEIPIVFEDRKAGVSKIDSSEIYRAAWHVLTTAVRARLGR